MLTLSINLYVFLFYYFWILNFGYRFILNFPFSFNSLSVLNFDRKSVYTSHKILFTHWKDHVKRITHLISKRICYSHLTQSNSCKKRIRDPLIKKVKNFRFKDLSNHVLFWYERVTKRTQQEWQHKTPELELGVTRRRCFGFTFPSFGLSLSLYVIFIYLYFR